MLKKLSGKKAKTYIQIRADWEEMQLLDAKNRFKAMRTISNDISEVYKSKCIDNIEQLDFYIHVLKQVIRVHDHPRYTRHLSKMIIDWLELTGNDKTEIIKKKSGKIRVETSISISDAHYGKDIINACSKYSELHLLNLINDGKAYIFNTVIHEICNVQVRVVDSVDPVLTSKEFKCVIDATDTVIINIPTGTLSIASPWNLEDEKDSLSINIDPGHYKVCAYLFYIHNKIESYYIVLCKTTNFLRNDLTRIYEIDQSRIQIN
ncbi:hypothetical protein [Legionella qingyii]|uniref:hypothetical protein n=1 Tax=Legionella qingyii TaxID=2184757 RepID=UPI000F8EEBC7|nr:hypothetical protein [Legionella qingyii]RUR22917.1 hypothetical protein ELY16_14235 [Legionella qingyii]